MASARASQPDPAVTPHAYAAVAYHRDWRHALDVTLQRVLAEDDASPDLLLLFASSAYAAEYPALVSAAYDASGTSLLLGCSARTVLAEGDCRDLEPGISLLACWLPDVHLTPIRLHADMIDALDQPDVWADLYQLPAEDVSGFLLFAEPYRIDTQEALVRLRTLYPGRPMVGALSSTATTERETWVFFDRHVLNEGGIALALGGPYDLDVIMAQGGEPIGEAWTITGAEANRISSISCRPAAEVMHETLAAARTGADDDRAVLLGFPMNEYQESFARGDFVVRGVVGVDEETGTIHAGSIPRPGQTIQFQLRDPDLAREELERALAAEAAHHEGAIAGLLCTCKGRGEPMFGVADVDAITVDDYLPELPVAGLVSFGEIGPVRGIPALNGFAASLGIIKRRRPL